MGARLHTLGNGFENKSTGKKRADGSIPSALSVRAYFYGEAKFTATIFPAATSTFWDAFPRPDDT